MKTEAKVGLFVFIGLIFLFLMSTQVSKFNNMGKKGYYIKAMIDDATGLEKNSKVKVNGVEVGYVKNFLLEANRVKAIIYIFNGANIPKDSVLYLAQDSILGSKQINIQAGDSKEFLKDGDFLENQKDLASLDKTSNSIYEAANEFKAFIKDLRETLDSNSRENLKVSFDNLKDTIENFKALSSDLKVLVAKNEANVSEAIFNLKNMGEELTLAGSKFQKIADNLNYKLPNIMSGVNEIVTELNGVTSSLKIKLPTLLSKFEKIEDNISGILAQNGEPLNSALRSADTFFSDGGETFRKVDELLGTFTKSDLELELREEYQISDGHTKDYVALSYSPSPSRYYLFDVVSNDDYSKMENGLYIPPKKHDDGEVYISAQFAKRYDDLRLRWGVIESTGGIGVDYFALNDKLKSSFSLYDFNAKNDVRGDNPHAKFSLRYTFLKHLDTYIGYDNFLNSKADNIFIGAGIRFIDNDLKLLLGSSGGSFLK